MRVPRTQGLPIIVPVLRSMRSGTFMARFYYVTGFAAALIGLSCMAFAADPFYIGTWKIVSAEPAPWSSRELPPDEPEMKELSGRVVTFTAKAIDGPHQAACKGPKYKVVTVPVE